MRVCLRACVCVFALVRACGCARAPAGRGNANNGPANCEAPNLALAVNGYATLHYSKNENTRVPTLTHIDSHSLGHAHTHSLQIRTHIHTLAYKRWRDACVILSVLLDVSLTSAAFWLFMMSYR